MAQFQHLDRTTRQSQPQDPAAHEKALLDYALLVADEDIVYLYMEENNIGLHNVAFWLARMRLAERQRDYRRIEELLKKARGIPEIKTSKGYELIKQYEKELEDRIAQQVQKAYTERGRTLSQYHHQRETIPMMTHKIFGDVKVYIDRQCRDVYRLECYIEAYERRCQNEKEYAYNQYLNSKRNLPYSWITLKEKDINNRFELHSKKEKRLSMTIQQPNRPMPETPKDKKIRSYRQLDSKEILKKIKFGKSPEFGRKSTPLDFSFQEELHTKRVSMMQKERFRGQDEVRKDLELFSFKKEQPYVLTQQPNEINNEARIEQSNNGVYRQENEDEQLKGMIREIQIQRYDLELKPTSTFSRIDSNKENNFNHNEINNQNIIERHREKRGVLAELAMEEVTPAEVLSMIHRKHDEINDCHNENSLKLEELLDYDEVDNMGFQRRDQRQQLSEKKERREFLSDIAEVLSERK